MKQIERYYEISQLLNDRDVVSFKTLITAPEISRATLKRLVVLYCARGTGVISERELSPQRLIHYRDNCYLDVWCHLRKGLRSFSVDAIRRVEPLDTKAKDVSEKRLDEVLSSGYGIFAGKAVTWARLKLSPMRALWLTAETWHPQQIDRLLEGSSCEQNLPYSTAPELLMNILKFSADCGGLEPAELRGQSGDGSGEGNAEFNARMSRSVARLVSLCPATIAQ